METNKIALVTGGSRGLGKNMALSIAKKGLDVVLTYHMNKENAEEVVNEIENMGQKAIALPLDVADDATFKDFFKNVSTSIQSMCGVNNIDYLVNNAGIGVNTAFTETTEEQLDTLYNIHLKGPYLFTQQALKMLNDGGGIINISSGLARFCLDGFSAYASMKGGMEVMTRYLAKELGGRKIRANTIAPGAIETDFGGGLVRDNDDMNKMIASTTALGRAGLPDDIGGVVAFLCTEDAKWVNGQKLEVSGGRLV